MSSSGEPTRRITTTAEDETEEMWFCVGVVTSDKQTVDNELNSDVTGPTYKVDVTVEGMKTRALVDNGSQVSLVRTEMLPRLKDLNNWTMEECKKKTQMVTQPVGAGSQVYWEPGRLLPYLLHWTPPASQYVFPVMYWTQENHCGKNL